MNNSRGKIILLGIAAVLIVFILFSSLKQFDPGESVTATVVEPATTAVDTTNNENNNSDKENSLSENIKDGLINEENISEAIGTIVQIGTELEQMTPEEREEVAYKIAEEVAKKGKVIPIAIKGYDENYLKYDKMSYAMEARVIYGFPSSKQVTTHNVKDVNSFNELQQAFIDAEDLQSHDKDEGEITSFKTHYKTSGKYIELDDAIMRNVVITSNELPKDCEVKVQKVTYDNVNKVAYIILEKNTDNTFDLGAKTENVKSAGCVINISFNADEIDSIKNIVVVMPK